MRSPDIGTQQHRARLQLFHLQRIASGQLRGEITALPGFETVAEVTLAPLIALIQVPDFYFVGVGVLCKPVAKCEMAVQTHEFAQIDIGDPRIASNDRSE